MDKEQIVAFAECSDPYELLLFSKEELSISFGNPFALMKGYSQNNPHHCYDLLEHTVVTLASLDIVGLSGQEAKELRIAALYHDIGKPDVAFDKDGRTVYYHHEEESAGIAKKVLNEAGFKKAEIKKICFYIEYHGAFISYKLKSELEEGFSHKYIKPITVKNVEERIAEINKESISSTGFSPSLHNYLLLLRLCIADAKAQSPVVYQKGKIVDSMKKKIERLIAIEQIINELDMQ